MSKPKYRDENFHVNPYFDYTIAVMSHTSSFIHNFK